MDVASLISAKKKGLSTRKDVKENKKTKTNDKSLDDDEADEANDAESSSNKGSDDESSDGSSESSEDDDNDDVDDDDSVDDEQVDTTHAEIQDALKLRSGADDDDMSENNDNESANEDEDDEEEEKKAAAFYDQSTLIHSVRPTTLADEIVSFSQLALSRPILRGIAAMGYVQPTPIQASVLPLALAGRDLCASAGSGKTAAFVLPLLERLIHRTSGRIKAVILMPTRELAAQCLGMMTTLMQFTSLKACLIVGGSKNLQGQAAELRARPDIVVATPGRLLDHVLNSAGVTLEDVEYLVLDEADRLLDLGFQDEVHEFIKACPAQRQTLLFSATMNTKVDDLVQLSLKRPIRVRISDKAQSKKNDLEVAPRLEQEFVRVRQGNEGVNREAMLLALLHRTYKNHVIVFFDTKATAHRLMIICGLCGIRCAELHGNLTQQQRLQALEDFREGSVDVLLATDLAARGLDISSVQAVINFEMPTQIERYIHRIGRTARAGRGGSSCTLIGEARRSLMKDLIKDAESKRTNETAGVIRSRTIPMAVISHFAKKIEELQPHIDEIVQAEAVARADRLAEMEINKAQNIIENRDAIMARPKREWFQSQKEREAFAEAAAEKKRLIEERAGKGTHNMTRKKRRRREALEAAQKLAEEAKSKAEESGKPVKPAPTQKVSAKVAKKTMRDQELHGGDNGSKKKKKARRIDVFGSSLFDDVNSERPNLTKKKAVEEKPTYFKFEEATPRMKKLKKQRGHKAFKSRAKFKRKR
jgi:ATP-dependent RNA helicase DDX27